MKLTLEQLRILVESAIFESEKLEEFLVSGMVAGVTTPLGTGPNYPNDRIFRPRRRRKKRRK